MGGTRPARTFRTYSVASTTLAVLPVRLLLGFDGAEHVGPVKFCVISREPAALLSGQPKRRYHFGNLCPRHEGSAYRSCRLSGSPKTTSVHSRRGLGYGR